MLTQQACNTTINYKDVTVDDRILPFVIALDLQNSNLSPAPGENQRFCYTVTGVGTDTSIYADLSHLVLGICDQITADQITNITVNGQVVQLGDKVELRTPENPDPPTGCAGLKFDYPVNKVGGTLAFCFELTTPYPVCPNEVCLFGGNVTADTLSICGPCCGSSEVCESVGYQPATVCVPVTVTPFANPGTTTTTCCGPTVIIPGAIECDGGTKNGSCHFTMSQDICVAVPVEFGARTFVGEPSVTCEDATDVDVCTNCGDTAEPVDTATALKSSNTNNNMFYKRRR